MPDIELSLIEQPIELTLYSGPPVPGPTGEQGETGASGATGPTGGTGPGVPVGGSYGQWLIKKSGADFDLGWTGP